MLKQDNYRAEIETKGDKDIIEKVFVSEIGSIKTERSSFTISNEKDRIKFIITAKDATALRATLNTITKVLSTIEKIKEIK